MRYFIKVDNEHLQELTLEECYKKAESGAFLALCLPDGGDSYPCAFFLHDEKLCRSKVRIVNHKITFLPTYQSVAYRSSENNVIAMRDPIEVNFGDASVRHLELPSDKIDSLFLKILNNREKAEKLITILIKSGVVDIKFLNEAIDSRHPVSVIEAVINRLASSNLNKYGYFKDSLMFHDPEFVAEVFAMLEEVKLLTPENFNTIISKKLSKKAIEKAIQNAIGIYQVIGQEGHEYFQQIIAKYENGINHKRIKAIIEELKNHKPITLNDLTLLMKNKYLTVGKVKEALKELADNEAINNENVVEILRSGSPERVALVLTIFKEAGFPREKLEEFKDSLSNQYSNDTLRECYSFLKTNNTVDFELFKLLVPYSNRSTVYHDIVDLQRENLCTESNLFLYCYSTDKRKALGTLKFLTSKNPKINYFASNPEPTSAADYLLSRGIIDPTYIRIVRESDDKLAAAKVVCQLTKIKFKAEDFQLAMKHKNQELAAQGIVFMTQKKSKTEKNLTLIMRYDNPFLAARCLSKLKNSSSVPAYLNRVMRRSDAESAIQAIEILSAGKILNIDNLDLVLTNENPLLVAECLVIFADELPSMENYSFAMKSKDPKSTAKAIRELRLITGLTPNEVKKILNLSDPYKISVILRVIYDHKLWLETVVDRIKSLSTDSIIGLYNALENLRGKNVLEKLVDKTILISLMYSSDQVGLSDMLINMDQRKGYFSSDTAREIFSLLKARNMTDLSVIKDFLGKSDEKLKVKFLEFLKQNKAFNVNQLKNVFKTENAILILSHILEIAEKEGIYAVNFDCNYDLINNILNKLHLKNIQDFSKYWTFFDSADEETLELFLQFIDAYKALSSANLEALIVNAEIKNFMSTINRRLIQYQHVAPTIIMQFLSNPDLLKDFNRFVEYLEDKDPVYSSSYFKEIISLPHFELVLRFLVEYQPQFYSDSNNFLMSVFKDPSRILFFIKHEEILKKTDIFYSFRTDSTEYAATYFDLLKMLIDEPDLFNNPEIYLDNLKTLINNDFFPILTNFLDNKQLLVEIINNLFINFDDRYDENFLSQFKDFLGELNKIQMNNAMESGKEQLVELLEFRRNELTRRIHRHYFQKLVTELVAQDILSAQILKKAGAINHSLMLKGRNNFLVFFDYDGNHPLVFNSEENSRNPLVNFLNRLKRTCSGIDSSTVIEMLAIDEPEKITRIAELFERLGSYKIALSEDQVYKILKQKIFFSEYAATADLLAFYDKKKELKDSIFDKIIALESPINYLNLINRLHTHYQITPEEIFNFDQDKVGYIYRLLAPSGNLLDTEKVSSLFKSNDLVDLLMLLKKCMSDNDTKNEILPKIFNFNADEIKLILMVLKSVSSDKREDKDFVRKLFDHIKILTELCNHFEINEHNVTTTISWLDQNPRVENSFIEALKLLPSSQTALDDTFLDLLLSTSDKIKLAKKAAELHPTTSTPDNLSVKVGLFRAEKKLSVAAKLFFQCYVENSGTSSTGYNIFEQCQSYRQCLDALVKRHEAKSLNDQSKTGAATYKTLAFFGGLEQAKRILGPQLSGDQSMALAAGPTR